MPKVSAATATHVDEFPVAIDRRDELDGYAVNFTSIRESHSLAPMLAGLPEGRCWCPHWGYVLKGEMTVTYADHEEVITAGDAFYMPPGHVPAATAGTEIVMISPADTMAETEAAIVAFMQSQQPS
jgi:hypothetical protein